MIKSDENGGYIIQKGTFALLMVIIALLSCVATVVAYGVSVKSDVEHLQVSVEKVTDKIPAHDRSIISNQEKILAMHEDIREIKSDIKGLISR